MNAEDVLFEVKKLDLKEGDVVLISYPVDYHDSIDEIMSDEALSKFCEEHKVTVLYFPGNFHVEVKHRDEMIKQLELVVKELKNGNTVRSADQDQ